MADDMADAVGTLVGKVAREAAVGIAKNGRKGPGALSALRKGSGPLSGMKGVAAGAGAAALVPLVTKGAGKLAKRALGNGADPVKKAQDKVTEGAKGAAGALPGVGKSGGKSGEQPGVGKGRRMPVQQAVDVAVPLSTAYNQWTQFEEWPKYMHRLQQVSQEDDSHLSFKVKIWGISREFKAEILEEYPDDRIKWHVTEGVTHTGVASFHKLAPKLTRVEVTLDVDPGSMIEKAGRGMRHVKRAVRADLARFKAYIEMEEEETGSWRGVIDDGEVKKSRGGGTRSSGGRGSKGSSGARKKSGSAGGRKSSSSGSGGRSSPRAKSSSSRARGRSSNSRRRNASGRASANGRGGNASRRKKASARS